MEFVYTPVHGSWLNVVEVEFSVLVRQCLAAVGSARSRRMRPGVRGVGRPPNAEGATVEWQFTTEDARVKLRRLYPIIMSLSQVLVLRQDVTCR